MGSQFAQTLRVTGIIAQEVHRRLGRRRWRPAYTALAMSPLRLAAGTLGLLLLAGCGGGAQQMAEPPVYAPANQTKCSIHKSSDHPLVVEWPSSDRAELEADAKHGLVVVRYEGCEMQLLPQCHVADSSYRYTPTTRKLEQVVITNGDELYANLPVGAAKLEGTLKKAGRLVVKMHVVGRFDAANPGKMKLEGLCQGATHVVTGLTAGAFDFYAGANGEAGGGLGVAGVGAGAKSTSRPRDAEPGRRRGGVREVELVGCGSAGRLRCAVARRGHAACRHSTAWSALRVPVASPPTRRSPSM